LSNLENQRTYRTYCSKDSNVVNDLMQRNGSCLVLCTSVQNDNTICKTQQSTAFM